MTGLTIYARHICLCGQPAHNTDNTRCAVCLIRSMGIDPCTGLYLCCGTDAHGTNPSHHTMSCPKKRGHYG